jgi:hypothetical protein
MARPTKSSAIPAYYSQLKGPTQDFQSAYTQYTNPYDPSLYSNTNDGSALSKYIGNYNPSDFGIKQPNTNFVDLGQTPSNQSALVDNYLNNYDVSIATKPYQPKLSMSDYTNPGDAAPGADANGSSALSRFFNGSFNPFNWNWTGKDGLLAPTAPGGKSVVEMGIGGLSSLASLWGAYNQKLYQDKMANLQKRAEDIYEQQVARQNQRQDLAQANYNASFR